MSTDSSLEVSPKRTIQLYKELHLVLQLIHDYVGTMPTNRATQSEQEIHRGAHEIIRELRQLKQSLLHEEQEEDDEAYQVRAT